MATKEVDLWITENPGGIRVDSVGLANLDFNELRALIEYLQSWLGKKTHKKENNHTLALHST